MHKCLFAYRFMRHDEQVIVIFGNSMAVPKPNLNFQALLNGRFHFWKRQAYWRQMCYGPRLDFAGDYKRASFSRICRPTNARAIQIHAAEMRDEKRNLQCLPGIKIKTGELTGNHVRTLNRA